MQTSLEVADIFRAAGPAYWAARAGHLSLDQLKVMSAIEICRTAVMGGHVEACTDCDHWRVAYNSCRYRHCPRHLSPVRKKNWVVYAKPPFAGPQAVLAYLSRFTHSNSRLIRFDEAGVTFRYKNYRVDGADRQQVMTLATDEFIRRFLLHFLPKGFHRIRHYGLLAGATRKAHLERARKLLGGAPPVTAAKPVEPDDARLPCPCCGRRMLVIEAFERWRQPRAPPHDTAPTGTTTP